MSSNYRTNLTLDGSKSKYELKPRSDSASNEVLDLSTIVKMRGQAHMSTLYSFNKTLKVVFHLYIWELSYTVHGHSF